MSVDIPGGLASAALIARLSEPVPEFARFVTTMVREYAGARPAVRAACAAAAAAAGPAAAVHAPAAMQAAAATRDGIRRMELPRVDNARCGNLGYVVKANIV
jgi:hypothetical protein